MSAVPNLSTTSSTLIVLVGLPARGKTFIASRLTRYLNWIGLETKIFNVGDYRRNQLRQSKLDDQDASFFDPDNQAGAAYRHRFMELAMEDLQRWLVIQPGRIAVLDATNTTRERRSFVLNKCASEKRVKINVFFIESICDDESVIEKTVADVKVNGPDYKNCSDKDKAMADFLERIEMYKKAYEPLCERKDDELSFIKVINVGQKFMVNRIIDHVQSKIVYYLMNAKVGKRDIYLSRHGESEFNVLGRIGGDAGLSPRGMEYAKALAQHLNENLLSKNENKNVKIFVSELQRTQQTASLINHQVEAWKALNEINAGLCEGMTYKEIQETFPDEFARRDENKYHYRYPMGESYFDLVQRLEPVIIGIDLAKKTELLFGKIIFLFKYYLWSWNVVTRW